YADGEPHCGGPPALRLQELERERLRHWRAAEALQEQLGRCQQELGQSRRRAEELAGVAADLESQVQAEREARVVAGAAAAAERDAEALADRAARQREADDLRAANAAEVAAAQAGAARVRVQLAAAEDAAAASGAEAAEVCQMARETSAQLAVCKGECLAWQASARRHEARAEHAAELQLQLRSLQAERAARDEEARDLRVQLQSLQMVAAAVRVPDGSTTETGPGGGAGIASDVTSWGPFAEALADRAAMQREADAFFEANRAEVAAAQADAARVREQLAAAEDAAAASAAEASEICQMAQEASAQQRRQLAACEDECHAWQASARLHHARAEQTTELQVQLRSLQAERAAHDEEARDLRLQLQSLQMEAAAACALDGGTAEPGPPCEGASWSAVGVRGRAGSVGSARQRVLSPDELLASPGAPLYRRPPGSASKAEWPERDAEALTDRAAMQREADALFEANSAEVAAAQADAARFREQLAAAEDAAAASVAEASEICQMAQEASAQQRRQLAACEDECHAWQASARLHQARAEQTMELHMQLRSLERVQAEARMRRLPAGVRLARSWARREERMILAMWHVVSKHRRCVQSVALRQGHSLRLGIVALRVLWAWARSVRRPRIVRTSRWGIREHWRATRQLIDALRRLLAAWRAASAAARQLGRLRWVAPADLAEGHRRALVPEPVPPWPPPVIRAVPLGAAPPPAAQGAQACGRPPVLRAVPAGAEAPSGRQGGGEACGWPPSGRQGPPGGPGDQ
ncbi:unnamed protein product, partial [Prorocentrum cordatum]